MPFDNPSSTPTPNGAAAWSGLEDRIQRLLDIVVKLRSANGQLMKENQKLKLQAGQSPSLPSESQDEEMWRRKYEEALQDLQQLKGNVEQLKKLMDEKNAARS